MKSIIFTLSFFLLLCVQVQGQHYATNQTSKAEVSKLGFITGNWKGSGWMMGRDGQKAEFVQTEKIHFKLDSTAILIEGLGKKGDEVIHNAMAIVSYNKEDNNYFFQSYLQNGRKGEFKGEIIDGKFYWYPGETMRYIIELNDKGQWFEIGETKHGDKWFQFFEMTLDRVD